MAVNKHRTGVDRGFPVNNDFPVSRENTGEILSTPVQPPPDTGLRHPAKTPEHSNVPPSRARSGAVESLADWVRAHAAEVRGWPAVAGSDRACLVDSCDRSVFASALCKAHYKHAVVTRRAAPKTSGQPPRGSKTEGTNHE